MPLQGRALCLHKALLLITPFSQHCFHFRQCTGRSPDNIYWPGNWSMLSSHACSNSTTSPSVQYAMMLPWSLQCSSYRFLSLLVNLQSNTNHWMELCTRWRNTSAIKQKQHEDLYHGDIRHVSHIFALKSQMKLNSKSGVASALTAGECSTQPKAFSSVVKPNAAVIYGTHQSALSELQKLLAEIKCYYWGQRTVDWASETWMQQPALPHFTRLNRSRKRTWVR